MTTWNHTGWESTNPLQDRNSEAVDLKNGTTSRRRIVAERGGNVRDVDAERAEDKEREEALGLSSQIMPSQGTARGEQVGPFSDEPVMEDDEDA
jgi:capsid protein